jgi:hypothetical protein
MSRGLRARMASWSQVTSRSSGRRGAAPPFTNVRHSRRSLTPRARQPLTAQASHEPCADQMAGIGATQRPEGADQTNCRGSADRWPLPLSSGADRAARSRFRVGAPGPARRPPPSARLPHLPSSGHVGAPAQMAPSGATLSPPWRSPRSPGRPARGVSNGIDHGTLSGAGGGSPTSAVKPSQPPTLIATRPCGQ